MLRCSQQIRRIARRSQLLPSFHGQVRQRHNEDDAPVSSLLNNFIRKHEASQRRQETRLELLQSDDGHTKQSVAKAAAGRGDRDSLIVTGSALHHDLASYLTYCKENKVNLNSTVHIGTLYEYIVAEALKEFGIVLRRQGKAGDLGVDLMGTWKQPTNEGLWRDQRLFIQCKTSKAQPAHIRELEGAYRGLPAAWRGSDILALLVSSHEASRGVYSAISQSQLPLGFVRISREGEITQFIWNEAAKRECLPSVGVTQRYGSSKSAQKEQRASSTIGLLWNGQPWPSV